MSDRERELLRRSDIFGALSQKGLDQLVARMRRVKLHSGEVLFSQGAESRDVYFVTEGRVRISTLAEDGRELSFAHALPGDIIGEISALDGRPRSADATALTDVTLLTLAQSAFLEILKENSTAALATIQTLCMRIRELSEHVEGIVFHTVDVRVARMLQDRCEGITQQPAGNVVLDLGVSQSELALLAGTTRQRVNAALTMLASEGAIARKGRKLEVNVAKLSKLARRT